MTPRSRVLRHKETGMAKSKQTLFLSPETYRLLVEYTGRHERFTSTSQSADHLLMQALKYDIGEVFEELLTPLPAGRYQARTGRGAPARRSPMTRSLNPIGGAIPRGMLPRLGGALACVGGRRRWGHGPAGPQRSVGQDKARVTGLIETPGKAKVYWGHNRYVFPLPAPLLVVTSLCVTARFCWVSTGHNRGFNRRERSSL